MPVKAKHIKDLPLKNEFDGSESLLVQDLNGTKQAPLEVIVDEIKQNSQEKIREVENELNEVENELNQKLNKNDIVTMANMGQDVKEAMTGGSVAVVGPDAVGAVNITNNSIGINKLNFTRVTNYINVDNISYNTIVSIETGKTLNDTKENDTQSITEVMECRPNETYTIDINTAGETTYVLFGDEGYNVLSYVQLTKNADGSSPTTFTVPTGAYYMRIRFLSEKASTAMLYKGTVIPDNYEKHSIEIPYLKLDENSLLEVNKYVKEKELKLKDKNIRFMIVSDIHFGKDDAFGTYRERFELLIDKVIQRYSEKPFDFIIMNGDITDFINTDKYFKSVKSEFLWRMPCPIFALKGNHDVVTDDLWVKTFGYNTQYSFETDDFYFICLDVYHKRTYLSNGKYQYNGVDYVYFENELLKAQSTGKKIVVIQHELDTSIDTKYYNICQKYGVLFRIVGHTHISVNRPVNNIFQINPGKWLFETTYGNNFSYNIVDIQGDQLVSTNYVIDESKIETQTSATIAYIEKEVSADIQVSKIKNNLCLLEKLNNIS